MTSDPISDEERERAVKRAAHALMACAIEEREELCLALLGKLWGTEPALSFLDEDLKADAEFWAGTQSPAVLAAYLPAIVDALEEARMGRSVRRWMVRAGLFGLPEEERKALLDEFVGAARKPRKPMNKIYAAALERRKSFHRQAAGASPAEAP